jgi:hypothetical protein
LTLICVLFESCHILLFTLLHTIVIQLQHLYDHQLANVRIFKTSIIAVKL